MATLWEQCAGYKWCVQIPFDGEQCLEGRACVRVGETSGSFYLELDAAGNTQRIPLGNACVEVRWYVFAAKACLANVNIGDHQIDFDIVLQLCIDANIGPIHIGECVEILKQHVQIGFFTVQELASLGFNNALGMVDALGSSRQAAYAQTSISQKALEHLRGQM